MTLVCASGLAWAKPPGSHDSVLSRPVAAYHSNDEPALQAILRFGRENRIPLGLVVDDQLCSTAFAGIGFEHVPAREFGFTDEELAGIVENGFRYAFGGTKAAGIVHCATAIHLAKAGVDTLDVNAALAQAPTSVQPHVSEFGSAAVKYRYDWQGVVIATMSILDTPRSLEYMPSFVFPAKPAPPDQGSAPPAQAYDGLWWRYGGASAGWVALANTTGGPVGVEVGVSGLSAPAGRSLVLPAHGATMLDLKDFFAGDAALVGGLHVAYSGPWGSVQVAGGLEDATKGFSADLPLAWHLPPATPPARGSWRPPELWSTSRTRC